MFQVSLNYIYCDVRPSLLANGLSLPLSMSPERSVSWAGAGAETSRPEGPPEPGVADRVSETGLETNQRPEVGRSQTRLQLRPGSEVGRSELSLSVRSKLERNTIFLVLTPGIKKYYIMRTNDLVIEYSQKKTHLVYQVYLAVK